MYHAIVHQFQSERGCTGQKIFVELIQLQYILLVGCHSVVADLLILYMYKIDQHMSPYALPNCLIHMLRIDT